MRLYLSLSQTTNLILFQAERVCISMMKTAESSPRKITKNVGKGEILLFPQCFQKNFTADT